MRNDAKCFTLNSLKKKYALVKNLNDTNFK